MVISQVGLSQNPEAQRVEPREPLVGRCPKLSKQWNPFAKAHLMWHCNTQNRDK